MRIGARMALTVLVFLALSSSPVAAETIRWIPAAASSPGLHGTVWTTDLWIYNKVADQPITVYLAFLPEADGVADPVEVSVEVPVLEWVSIQDAVGSLFGESRPGAIRLRAEHEFEARSRTFNSGGDVGTFGQGIPAAAPSAAVQGPVLLGASNQPTANGTRTNLGVLNPSSESIEVVVFVSGATPADYLGRADIELGPLGWWQGNVFDLIGRSSTDAESAMVALISFRQPVISYLSMLDNASGDGTYLDAVDGASVFTLPVDWTFDFTVTSSNATVDRLTVTVADNEPEVFTDLSTGAQVTLESYVGRFELCYSVDATATTVGQSGQVTIEYLDTPSYGSTGYHLHSEGGTGEFTIDICDPISPEPRLEP